jgi:urease accessory protein
MSRASLAGLLQLSSATLPVGSFSYSQGLENAVAAGVVRDEATLVEWLETLLQHGVGAWDAPWVAALMGCWRHREHEQIVSLNQRFLASRESRELWAETVQTGRSMLALLKAMGDLPADALTVMVQIDAAEGLAYPVAWAAAATHRAVDPKDALIGYLWAWLEGSVMAALRTAPIGQNVGQRILMQLGARLEALAAAAATCPLDECRNFLPGFTLACMQHETQYTRLFRS